MIPPFARTKCGCSGCVDLCKTHPGYLMPGDAEMIARNLGISVHDLSPRLAASPGAVVRDKQTNVDYRIPTIIAAPDATGRCNFLDEFDRCSIHDFAPFGCAYFDSHEGGERAATKSMWALRLIADDDSYHALRMTLQPTRSYKPKGY